MGALQWIARLAKPFVVERLPRVALAYRTFRESHRLFDEPNETPMGFRLIGDPRMESGAFEAGELEIVNRVLNHSEVFINVGANVGYYCCFALRQEKYTVAFEPMEENLRYLYRNLRANRWEDRVEVFPIALSDRVGLVEMFGGGMLASAIKGWAGTGKYPRLVPVSTLDTVLGTRFRGRQCFILVDIEGAEKDMLRGARGLLQSNPKPIWMVEICVRENQPEGVKVNPNLTSTFEIFWENGYEALTRVLHLSVGRKW